MDSAVPVVEVADHRDAHRIRRKDRKADARNTAHLLLVRAEECVRRRALACLELAEFHFRQFRHKAVRLLCDRLAAVCLRENELIAQTFLLPRNQTGKKAALIGQFHRHFCLAALQQDPVPSRKKGLHEYAFVCLMRSQDGVRICGLRVNNLFDCRPVHHLV